MNCRLQAVAALSLLGAVILAGPVASAQQPTLKQVSVNQFAAKPDAYVGKVAVVGRVAAVTPGRGFSLIDSANCANCATECLTDKSTKKIPCLWSGAAPTVKSVVLVQGTLAKTVKGFTFTAEHVTKQ